MVEPIEPPSNDNHRPARGGWERLRDADMIAALAAVLVGLCALAVSIYQSILMREQQQASVWPHVEIGREYRREDAGKHVFKLVIYNTGIGPARLKTMRVTLDGKPERDWAGVMKAMGVAESNIKTRATVTGRALLPGNNIEAIIAVDDTATSRLEQATTGDTPAFDLEICYCSIYGSCYRMRYTAIEETPVERCERDPKLDFQE